jgi:hypothetical protein
LKWVIVVPAEGAVLSAGKILNKRFTDFCGNVFKVIIRFLSSVMKNINIIAI